MMPPMRAFGFASLFALALAGCAAVPRGIEGDIEALERARFAAMTRQDTEALRPMLADDLVYCHSNARCESREQFLATLSSGTIRYLVMQPGEMQVRHYGDVALVNGRIAMEGLADGRPTSMQLAYLDAYVWQDGRWQLAAWQSTRVP